MRFRGGRRRADRTHASPDASSRHAIAIACGITSLVGVCRARPHARGGTPRGNISRYFVGDRVHADWTVKPLRETQLPRLVMSALLKLSRVFNGSCDGMRAVRVTHTAVRPIRRTRTNNRLSVEERERDGVSRGERGVGLTWSAYRRHPTCIGTADTPSPAHSATFVAARRGFSRAPASFCCCRLPRRSSLRCSATRRRSFTPRVSPRSSPSPHAPPTDESLASIAKRLHVGADGCAHIDCATCFLVFSIFGAMPKSAKGSGSGSGSGSSGTPTLTPAPGLGGASPKSSHSSSSSALAPPASRSPAPTGWSSFLYSACAELFLQQHREMRPPIDAYTQKAAGRTLRHAEHHRRRPTSALHRTCFVVTFY